MSYYAVNPITQQESDWFETPSEVEDWLVAADEQMFDWICLDHTGAEMRFNCSNKTPNGSFRPDDDFCINDAQWPSMPCDEHAERDD